MNTSCVSVHELMVRYRPEVHCNHIGPTGSGECDDTLTYTGTVEENLNVNSPWVAPPGIKVDYETTFAPYLPYAISASSDATFLSDD